MHRLRDQLLARAALAADQHRRVGSDHLGDVLIHLPHRSAVADDVGEFVALAQLLPQLGILLDQHLAFGVDQTLDPKRLRDHPSRDPQHLDHPLRVPLGAHRQLDRERAGGGPVEQDRHTEESGVLAPISRAGGAVEEGRLSADTRDDGRPLRLGHSARDALSDTVPHPPRASRIAESRFHDQHAGGLLQHGDRPAHRATTALEHLENRIESSLQVQRPGECLPHLHEGAELPDLAAIGVHLPCGRRGFCGAGRRRTLAALGQKRRHVEDDLAWRVRHGVPDMEDRPACTRTVHAFVPILQTCVVILRITYR